MSIRITLASSLEKIFDNAPLPESYDRLCLLRGERGGLQCAVVCDADADLTVSVASQNPCRLYL
ncbi:MAG: hypothetical protein IJK98_12105, partial [Clostridia bacterium]|nr:hypothetical protein [Clostridia bacterium]